MHTVLLALHSKILADMENEYTVREELCQYSMKNSDSKSPLNDAGLKAGTYGS